VVDLKRIAEIDSQVHAFVYIDPEARPGAGPLAGTTLGVKDTQPVKDMPWTYGSIKWRDRVADFDAIPVARARAAGATVLGKTNTPELAASVGCVNELFPPTENPWRPGYTPGGSSGGSGAAVAAGLCTFALGDDMGGSIRIPAAACGVFGLRPTWGAVPKEDPEPTRLSVRGPLARSVADLRLLFAAVSARAPAEPAEPRALRIAYAAESPLGLDDACRQACLRAVAALEARGHQLEPVAWEPLPVAAAYRVIRPASVAGMPGEPSEYGAAVRGLIERGRSLGAREYLAAVVAGARAVQPIRALFETGFDALLTPALGMLPMPIAEVPTFLAEGWDRYTQFVLPVSFTGLPAVSVPAGLQGGLPLGVQLVGAERGEWELLDLAQQLAEQPGFGFQPPPLFLSPQFPERGGEARRFTA
jgi:Asp-tRNA(Asn)/Glu-tRNA(Gln) amidotransferase A subunit family amidase